MSALAAAPRPAARNLTVSVAPRAQFVPVPGLTIFRPRSVNGSEYMTIIDNSTTTVISSIVIGDIINNIKYISGSDIIYALGTTEISVIKDGVVLEVIGKYRGFWVERGIIQEALGIKSISTIRNYLDELSMKGLGLIEGRKGEELKGEEPITGDLHASKMHVREREPGSFVRA